MDEKSDDDLRSQGTNEPDWEDIMYEREKEPVRNLDLTDYAALFLAALQTVFLPLVILGIVLVGMTLLFRLFAP